MGADRIVIVGAGMAGAATAFALARRGAAVTVVDDGRAGQATAAGAGIVARGAGRKAAGSTICTPPGRRSTRC